MAAYRLRETPTQVVEAEQVMLNLILGIDGRFAGANNPFGVVQMRRPRWYSLHQRPMAPVAEGWAPVEPFDWLALGPDGFFRVIGPNAFSSLYTQA